MPNAVGIIVTVARVWRSVAVRVIWDDVRHRRRVDADTESKPAAPVMVEVAPPEITAPVKIVMIAADGFMMLVSAAPVLLCLRGCRKDHQSRGQSQRCNP